MRINLSPEALSDLRKLKESIATEFGSESAKKILSKITDSIRNLERFPNAGIDVAAKYNVPCNYKCLVASKNYIFFRIDGDTVHIVRVLDERQDFMRVLFDIKTTPQETEDYWQE